MVLYCYKSPSLPKLIQYLFGILWSYHSCQHNSFFCFTASFKILPTIKHDNQRLLKSASPFCIFLIQTSNHNFIAKRGQTNKLHLRWHNWLLVISAHTVFFCLPLLTTIWSDFPTCKFSMLFCYKSTMENIRFNRMEWPIYIQFILNT